LPEEILVADSIRDLRFSGFVTWTGNSSMEVVVKMQGSRSPSEGGSEAEGGEKLWDTLMLGRFAMVCRDRTTNKSRRVPPLIVETEEEKKLWEISGGESWSNSNIECGGGRG
jgi:acyl-coenzyme A thioesterase 9